MSWPQWSAGSQPQPPLPSVLNPAPAVAPPGSQYTPEQWAQLQQQNWNQWAQWQQQYQQWHQQYGAEYQKSLNALNAQVVQQQPPVTPLPNVAVPPPLPAENTKPPLPLDDPPAYPPAPLNQPPIQPAAGYVTGSANQPSYKTPPSVQPPNYGTAPPNSTNYSTRPNQQQPPSQRNPHDQPNWQNRPRFTDNSFQSNNKRSYESNDRFDSSKRQMSSRAGWPSQSPSNPPPTKPVMTNQPPPAATTSAAKPPLKEMNIEELAEAEKKFDKQFADWEAQFNKWKEQNVEHPDKTQYKEYEKKWENWRAQLLERREQMKRKRISLMAGSPGGGMKPLPPKPSVPDVSPRIPPLIPPLMAFNKPVPGINDEPLKFNKATNFEPMDEDVGDFLKANRSGGIPGLDLVRDEIKAEAADVVMVESGKEPSEKKGPDFEAISRGINTILGDQKLLNMLSMVSQNQSAQPTDNVLSSISMTKENSNTERSHNANDQSNLSHEEYSNMSDGYGQQRDFVNNFDDQTRSSFTHNEQEPRYDVSSQYGRNQSNQGPQFGNKFGGLNKGRDFDERFDDMQFGPRGDNSDDYFDNSKYSSGAGGFKGDFDRNRSYRGDMDQNRQPPVRNDFAPNKPFGQGAPLGPAGLNDRPPFGGKDNFPQNNRPFGRGDPMDSKDRQFGDRPFGSRVDQDRPVPFKSGPNQDSRFGSDDDRRSGQNDNRRFGQNDDRRFGQNDDRRFGQNDDRDSFHGGGNYNEDRQFGFRGPKDEGRQFAPRDNFNQNRQFGGRGDMNQDRFRSDDSFGSRGNRSHGAPIGNRRFDNDDGPRRNEAFRDLRDSDSNRNDQFRSKDDFSFDRGDNLDSAADDNFSARDNIRDDIFQINENIDPPEDSVTNKSETVEDEADNGILKPSTVIDYDHKSLKAAPEPEVLLEPIYMFDYRHKPLSRIPLPQRPKWLLDAVRNIREFDPPIVRPYEIPRRYASGDNWKNDRPYQDDSYHNRRSYDNPRQFENKRFENKYDDSGYTESRQRSYDDSYNENRQFDKRPYDKYDDSRSYRDDRKPPYQERKQRDDSRPDFTDFDGGESPPYIDDVESLKEAKTSQGGENKPERVKYQPKNFTQNRHPQRNDVKFDKNDNLNKPENSRSVILIEDIISPPGRFNRPARLVIILRGPPGSGKTFLAKLIKDKEVENGGSPPRILSLDDYFMVEHEKEIVEEGRRVKIKEMIYEYEAEMEESYRTSLIKSFKKTITDGYFPFIVVDNINDKVKYFGEMWSFAKQNGFQVYICQLDLDVQTCSKRNIHDRSEADIEKCVAGWEPTPSHHPLLDATSLLQSGSIPEVEMEEVNSPESDVRDNEGSEEDEVTRSKWDNFDCSVDNLAKLDGVSRPLRPSRTMEEYLQMETDWSPAKSTKPGQKRVRWADLEEQKQQEKMRAIGFVVGQTNWERMMDPTKGSSALTQTKYIDRATRY